MEKLSSKELIISWEYPITLNPKESFLDVKLKSPNLFALFNFKPLTLAPREPLDPLGITLTSAVNLSYPIPEFITTALIILPSWITGLTLAPDPVPASFTSKSGAEKYPSPLLTTVTLVILPFTTTGLSSPFFPVKILTSGFIWWFKIVDP